MTDVGDRQVILIELTYFFEIYRDDTLVATFQQEFAQ
ncbi:Uncharacterised protein [Yersinia enterocolitica]|nr:Uncharacterised protein [Yersinia enterocolitica]